MPGHSTIAMTVDTYGLVVVDQQVWDAMDRAFSTAFRTVPKHFPWLAAWYGVGPDSPYPRFRR